MTIIRTVLQLLRARLNASFQAIEARSEDWVALVNPVDHDGRVNDGARNKIVMTLVGLQQDTTIATFGGPTVMADNQYAITAPPIFINVHLLFTANFGDANYAAGLNMIGGTIAFFQRNPVFTPDRLPGLPPEIDKLVLELINLDFMQTNYLMSMLGLKYLPSVLYRIRMLPFADGAISGTAAPYRGPRSPSGPNV